MDSCQKKPVMSDSVIKQLDEDYAAELKYNTCRLNAVKCQKNACRNIFAYLTEMSYCLSVESNCCKEYRKYLDTRKSVH